MWPGLCSLSAVGEGLGARMMWAGCLGTGNSWWVTCSWLPLPSLGDLGW